MNRVKYLKPFYYFLITLYSLWHSCAGSGFHEKYGNVHQCGGGGGGETSLNPLEMGMSPGFISGSTSYIGHHLCTIDGTCEKPPLLCPQSSCCLSTHNTTNMGSILLPVSYSQCGCYDPKRKTCKPQNAFRLDWDNCGDDGHVTSKFELAQISSSDLSCKESALVDLDIDNENGDVRIRIKSRFCLSKAGSNHRGLADKLSGALLGGAEQEISGLGNCLEAKLLETAKGLSFSKYSKGCCLTPPPERDQSKIYNCANNPVSNTVTMSPGLIPFGGINNFGNPSICGSQGHCQNSLADCQGTSCCLVSFGGNSSGGSCECLPGNSGNCLLDHKTFTIGHTACTPNGEVVQRKLTIRIPSASENNCKNGTSSSWAATSVDFENNENGKLEIVVETRQCVLSSSDGGYLEVDEVVRAEINVEEIEKKMEVLEQQLRPCAGRQV